MINIIDSGFGAYNTVGYLIESDKKYKEMVNISLLPHQIGNKNIDDIRNIFDYKIYDESLNVENTFIACNTLNSLYLGYNGAFNELILYLHNNKDKDSLVLATDNTCRQLNQIKGKHFECMSIKQDIIRDIDKGIVPNIDLKTDLFDNLILGCTHFDNINFNTNMEVVSTSMLGANRLKEMIDATL